MNETLLGFFVAITAIAVLIQMGVMVGLFLSVKKSSEKMEKLATQLESKLSPILDSSREILADSAPKLKEITANLVDASSSMKTQAQKLETVMKEVSDRSHLQIIRMDQMLSSTLNKVESTTELLHETIFNPVKQVSGIIQGISMGLGAFLNRKKKSPEGGAAGASGQDDEMF